jgi:hypothetical protein
MTPEQRAAMQQALDVLQKGDVLCEFVACKILSAELAKPDRVPLTRAQVQTIVERKHFRVGYFLSPSDKTLLSWYRQGLRDGEAEHGITGDKS